MAVPRWGLLEPLGGPREPGTVGGVLGHTLGCNRNLGLQLRPPKMLPAVQGADARAWAPRALWLRGFTGNRGERLPVLCWAGRAQRWRCSCSPAGCRRYTRPPRPHPGALPRSRPQDSRPHGGHQGAPWPRTAGRAFQELPFPRRGEGSVETRAPSCSLGPHRRRTTTSCSCSVLGPREPQDVGNPPVTGVFPDGSPERLGPRSSGGPWAPASPQVLTGTSHVTAWSPALLAPRGGPCLGRGSGLREGVWSRDPQSGRRSGCRVGVQGRGPWSGQRLGHRVRVAVGAQGQRCAQMETRVSRGLLLMSRTGMCAVMVPTVLL